jgi:hypothetical protein
VAQVSDLEGDALTLLLVKVVRDRLALLDDAARERVKASLKPGARWIVSVPLDGEDVEVGGVTRTKPAAAVPAPKIVDGCAFLEWVQAHRPEEVVTLDPPPPPGPMVRPSFERWVLEAVAGKHEVPDGGFLDTRTGEVLDAPPGVEWVTPRAGTSTLQVRAADGGEAVLLQAMRSGALALPAVLDDPVALEP